MARIKKDQHDEYIVVHHVRGEEDVLEFLRNTNRVELEALCYQARLGHEAVFRFHGVNYTLTFQKDSSYLIEPRPTTQQQLEE